MLVIIAKYEKFSSKNSFIIFFFQVNSIYLVADNY